jgi:phenolic acid decarboxylase
VDVGDSGDIGAEEWFPHQDLDPVVGYRFIYTYANGWQYELYVKNGGMVDYRIHTGHVGGRWVKDQAVDLIQLDNDCFKISWTEPTGTCVVLNVMPGRRRWHGVIFFPAWVRQHGERTVLFQNDHLSLMHEYRDQGPTYPIYVVSEFARITFAEYIGPDDDTVISCAPADLPLRWASRTN